MTLLLRYCWVAAVLCITTQGLDESLQVCPSSLYVEIPDDQESATVSITITNLSTEVAYISVWVNDTFNNVRDAEWRAGTATLPPHDLYDYVNPTTDIDQTVDYLDQASRSFDPLALSLDLDPAKATEPIPAEWRQLTLILPESFKFPESGASTILDQLAHKALKTCKFMGSTKDPAWSRKVECPVIAAKLEKTSCRIQATVGADNRSLQLRVNAGCKQRELIDRLAEYKDAFGALKILRDSFLPLASADEIVLSSSSRDAPAFNPGWPSEWVYEDDYELAKPLHWTNATKEWPTVAQTSIAKSPSVMIIDTYVRLDHPDLTQNYVLNSEEILGSSDFDDDGDAVVDNLYGIDGANMEQGDPRWDDSSDHGTAVAGIVAARPSNDVGVAGFAPNLRVLPCGAGTTSLSMSATINCMQFAIHNARRFNVRVINHSYSGTSYRPDEHAVFETLADMGMIHTVASGNVELNLTEGTGPPTPLLYLAKYGIYTLIGVGRLDVDGKPQASGHSKHWTSFYFPGELPMTYINHEKVGIGSGTSFAAPAAAAMIGEMVTVNPMLEPFDVLWILENSIVPVSGLEDKCRYGGFPDVGRAIRASQGLWARVAESYDRQFAMLPGETRTIDITVRVKQSEDDADEETERNGYVVIYGKNDAKLSQVYKLGEIPLRVVRDE